MLQMHRMIWHSSMILGLTNLLSFEKPTRGDINLLDYTFPFKE
jgi:hypothetical protein